MKNCPYKRWIHKFIDGELDNSYKDEFKRHLTRCLACKKELEELRGIKGMLSYAREERPSPQLKYRVMSGIAGAEAALAQQRLRIDFLYRRTVPVLAAAALLFAVISAWDVRRFYSQTDVVTAFLEEGEIGSPDFEPDIL